MQIKEMFTGDSDSKISDTGDEDSDADSDDDDGAIEQMIIQAV